MVLRLRTRTTRQEGRRHRRRSPVHRGEGIGAEVGWVVTGAGRRGQWGPSVWFSHVIESWRRPR